MVSIKSDAGFQVDPNGEGTIGEALARGAIGTRQASIPYGLEEIDNL